LRSVFYKHSAPAGAPEPGNSPAVCPLLQSHKAAEKVMVMSSF
jgi:hypothetical protein